MIKKLIFWGIFVGIYYGLWAIAGLSFSLILLVLLLSVLLLLFLGKNSWWLRAIGYLAIMISLFSDGENTTPAAFARLGILILGFLGLGIEYLYQLGNSEVSKEKVAKDFKTILGRCPKCLKEISRFSKKCPYCTTDL
jgi:signal transduction histidine kinase